MSGVSKHNRALVYLFANVKKEDSDPGSSPATGVANDSVCLELQ